MNLISTLLTKRLGKIIYLFVGLGNSLFQSSVTQVLLKRFCGFSLPFFSQNNLHWYFFYYLQKILNLCLYICLTFKPLFNIVKPLFNIVKPLFNICTRHSKFMARLFTLRKSLSFHFHLVTAQFYSSLNSLPRWYTLATF